MSDPENKNPDEIAEYLMTIASRLGASIEQLTFVTRQADKAAGRHSYKGATVTLVEGVQTTRYMVPD